MLYRLRREKLALWVFPKESKNHRQHAKFSKCFFVKADRKSIRFETSNYRFVGFRLFCAFSTMFPQLQTYALLQRPCQNEQLHDHLQNL